MSAVNACTDGTHDPASGTLLADHGCMSIEHAQAHRHRRRWSDLSPAQQRAIVAAGIVQVGLATAAWVDLARRPATAVRGPKAAWAAAIAVNFAGPVAYFIWGRKAATSEGLAPSA